MACAALCLTAMAACVDRPAGNAPAATVPPSLAERVAAVMSPLVEAHEFSGAVVLARGTEVVLAAGYGLANHDAGVAFTPDTPSDGASLAKTFTAAAVRWLAHEGRVALDADLRTYLPAYPHAGVTVRHAIGHSNGLPDSYEFFDAHFPAGAVRTTDGMLDVVARVAPRPAFTPGTRFEYSSLGYDVAARVVERVTGVSFERVLQDRFFSRLGMSASFVRPARLTDWVGVRTLGYRWTDGGWRVFDVYDGEGFAGGSNLYLSAHDVSRWARAFATGTALPAGVMAEGNTWTTVSGRTTPLTGLNWYCDAARERCYYTGDLNAFYSFAYWDRVRGESVAFVSNSALPMWRRPALSRALVDVLAGRDAPVEMSPPAGFERFAPETRGMTAGVYAVDGLGTVTLRHDGERLVFRVDDGLELAAFPVAPDVFYVPGADYWLAFSAGRPPRTIHVRSALVRGDGRRVP